MIGKKVLVTTEYRGVFFGELESENDEKSVVMKGVRNCIYWGNDVRGFIGLAANGPTASCKIGPPASRMKLHKVTAIAEIAAAAVKKWEAAPWA